MQHGREGAFGHLLFQDVADILVGLAGMDDQRQASDAGSGDVLAKATLLHLARALFGADREVRFATDFFPFTEPSLQAAVSCFLCEGAGCAVCKQTGWIEMGGSGLVDPNVLSNVGYDPEEVSGFAFGLGLERIAMLRHGVPDIRMFWENDLRFLSQF